jgi:anti-anti-sigma factor
MWAGVATARHGARTIVAFRGELDAATCAKLDAELADALDSDCEEIVLDLSELAFLDSSGLRSILRARTKASQVGKRFELVRPGGAAQRALDVSGLG